MADDGQTLPAWAPTPDRIASLLWEHTRASQNTLGEGGVLLDQPTMGAFTENTTPTLELVEQLIDQACDTMAGLLEGHEPCNTAMVRGVRGATAYLAAALAEAARESQASTGDGTTYSALYDLWLKSGAAIAARVVAVCPFVPAPGEEPDTPGSIGPVAILPCHPERVTWQTEF
jgi:hypothetical protein